MAHLTDLDLIAPADSLFSGGTVLNTWRTRIDALNDILGDITTAEANQVENIAATTISAAQWAYVGALNQGLTTTSTVTFGTINAFTLGGKLTAGAVEIEGSAFDINGGTIDGITSLTAGGNLDIGAHGFTANTLTADGLTPGRLVRAGTGGLLGDATVTESSGALGGITTLSMNNQLTNSLADGTTPFVITSTTKVSNLNVERVDGAHASSTPTASYIVIADASGFLHTPGSAPDANYEVANKKYVDDTVAGKDTFLELTDTPAGYTTNGAIYVADNSNTQIDESTVILTEAANTFAIAKGSASLDIAAGATLNIDVGLQVTTNAGTLVFSAASKTLTIEENSNINQDLSSDASPTFAGLALGSGSITMSGSIGVTGTRVTKLWADDIESTNPIAADITGDAATCSGEAATVATITGLAPDTATTQATQGNITSIANLATIGTVTSGTLSTGAVLADVTMTLGSDADGDIYYRASNKLTRLGKGSATEVLTMNAGETAPEWAAAAGGGAIDISGTPVTNDYARWTDADTLEGREVSEVFTDLGLDSALANLTATEIAELENIADTTISAAQWGYLGACGAGGGQLLAALTTGESTQLETIGDVTVSYAQWGYLGALTTHPIGGDGTAGLKFRQARVTIANGTNNNTLKCTVVAYWNGDTIAETDNIAKNATTGDFSLNADGKNLTIEASGLTGNAVLATGFLNQNACGTDLTALTEAYLNDILIKVYHATTAVKQDMTTLVDTGNITLSIDYITDA